MWKKGKLNFIVTDLAQNVSAKKIQSRSQIIGVTKLLQYVTFCKITLSFSLQKLLKFEWIEMNFTKPLHIIN